jgi:ABC-2 type transport system permease protein
VISPGFGESLKAGRYTPVDVYSTIDSFSLTSMMSGVGGHAAVSMINSIISHQIRSDSGITEDIFFLTNPVYSAEHTFLNNTTERISAHLVLSYVSSQTMFIPVIIFFIIMVSSQMLAASMVNEKVDKTLETLMTAPISRMSVLITKILSAAIYSAIYAVVYILAFRNFNEGMTGGGTLPDNLIPALENFGITFNSFNFTIIGAQLFLSVLCGLAISLIIGMMVDDIKTLQSYILPLTIIIMIPYLLSMVLDINSLPAIAQIAVYAIPFTHSFTAASNLFTANYTLIIIGFVYQAAFAAAMMTIAVKIFNSDKLFTLGQILMKNPGAKKSLFAKK